MHSFLRAVSERALHCVKHLRAPLPVTAKATLRGGRRSRDRASRRGCLALCAGGALFAASLTPAGALVVTPPFTDPTATFSVRLVGSKTGAQVKAAIDAAVALAKVAGGGKVLLPRGSYDCDPLAPINGNSIKLIGQGDFVGGTQLRCTAATGDFMTFTTSGHMGAQDLYLTVAANVRRTAGYAIRVTGGAFKPFFNQVRVDYHYDGIRIDASSQGEAVNVSLRYMLGSNGFHVYGETAGVYGFTLQKFLSDNPYPINNNGARKAWAASTAYSLGDITSVNGNVYNCSTAGTSAASGSGPSGIPGTGGADAFSMPIADGTAAWRFVCSASLAWIISDSRAYSIRIETSCAALGGNLGLQMRDTLATGSSYPIWTWARGLEVDHPYSDCVRLSRGEGFYAVAGCWFGSSLTGHGVNIGANHRGEISISDATRIMGNWQNGITWALGPTQITITGTFIGANSQAGAGTFHGILVPAGATNFIITANHIGRLPAATTATQGYAVFVLSGASDKYEIINNICTGNVSGAVNDGGTGASKVVSGNIV